MEVLTFIIAALSALGTIVSAGVALYIARLTAKTIEAYNKQIQIGQDQIKAMQEQTFNQARPILLPTDIGGLLQDNQGTMFIQWGVGQPLIGGLRNIGSGPAFNIYGIFFGTPFQGTPPSERYVIWNYEFLAPGASGPQASLSKGT